MPKPLLYVIVCLIVLAMIPPAIIARARAKNSPMPRVHLVQDMDNMGRFKAQQASPVLDNGATFADGRAMRPPVAGAVARGSVAPETPFESGIDAGTWLNRFPAEVTVDAAFLERGRERFNIFCTPCHGYAGYGDGLVHLRADRLAKLGTNGTAWVAPKNIHEQAIREQPLGQLYNTIANGVRTMAGYKSQIPTDDRWAIVAYVKALQRSQNARSADVPAGERESLPVVNLVPPPTEGGAP